MRTTILFLTLAFSVMLTGCMKDGQFTNPFADDEAASSGASYYTSEFTDIPVPKEMSESRSQTFITIAHSGVKCGLQVFSGRVETVSLMNTMRRYMANNGWALRSLLRAKESILVFEKPDRIATVQVSDGMLSTEMHIFVSARLEGDSNAVEINPFPGSGEGEQKLTQ